jgi:D-alanyl-lipoteichoic acid acyltransferase DltB (MBOAT superfamily)
LRDYLYISLGGNRGGPVKTQRNLFLTMTIGGLWHGASWHFVLWGMYHGLLLILHRLITPVLSLLRIDGWLPSMLWFWIRVILFFQCICVGWILFRADTATQAWNMLTTIATDLNPNSAAWEMAVRLLGFTWPLLIVQLWQWKLKNLNFFLHLSPPVKAVFVAIALYLLSVHGTSTDSFIYFQF